MSDYAIGVKKVPFDGTHENFYLWTTQLLGFAETYNCEQALLGTLKVPASTDVLESTKDADKIKLAARRSNSTAICPLRISLTDKVSQSALYNSKTTDLPLGSAAKAWKNLYKLYCPVNVNKMNELRKKFASSTLYKDDTNPDEWFAELYSLRQRLEDDYNLDQYGDTFMLDQIIYNTKPAAYRMQLAIIKDQIILEDIRLKADIKYEREVTLDYVQAKYREIYATLKQHQGKSSSKGPVKLLTTGTTPTTKKFTMPFTKDCSLCGKQGHKSMDSYTRAENAHNNPYNKATNKALVTAGPPRSTLPCTSCKRTGHAEKNCYKKRNDQNKIEEHAQVILFFTEHSLFTNNATTTFTPNTYIADSGAKRTTCAVLLKAC
jgi:hypothetical protein